MPDLTHADPGALRAFHDDARQKLDAFATRGLKLDLTRGKPANAQLDLSSALLGLPGPSDYVAADKTDARNYGGLQGLAELRALLAPAFGLTPETTIIGGNTSLGLMHDAIVYALLSGTPDSAQPWSREGKVKFLCPVPGYDRHFAICEDFGIEMVLVPIGEDGPDMDRVEDLVAKDAAIKGMWCIPKYSNPTGTVYSDTVVDRLAKMSTAAPDFRIWWDNAYALHHLTDDRIEIASLVDACARHGHASRALVFGSTSKMTLAGAGVAIFGSSPANVAWYLKRMGRRTIGGDKVNQLRHVRLLKNLDGLLARMDEHRAIIAPKFTTVLETFDRFLGGTGVARWTRPKGGYFISLDVLDGTAARTIALAKDAGIALTPAGSAYPYRNDPADRNIRIAPSFPPAAELDTAMDGLATCVLLSATEKLLG